MSLTIFTQCLRDTHIDPSSLVCKGIVCVVSRIGDGRKQALASLHEEVGKAYPNVAVIANARLMWEMWGHPSNNNWVITMVGDAYEVW